jgi:hypothetical protein
LAAAAWQHIGLRLHTWQEAAPAFTDNARCSCQVIIWDTCRPQS